MQALHNADPLHIRCSHALNLWLLTHHNDNLSFVRLPEELE